MTIKEICEASGLTKKAVAYYEEKGLICPDVRENGYREYRKEDVQTLREVACLRFYGLTVSSDQTGFGKWRQSWHDHSASCGKRRTAALAEKLFPSPLRFG